MDRARKSVLVTVALVVVVGLAGVAVAMRTELISALADGLDQPGLCHVLENPFGKAGCVADVAHRRREPTLCALIEDLASRDLCASYIAQHLEDTRLCARVTVTVDRSACYSLIARETDTDVCDPLSDARAKAECYEASLHVAAEMRGTERCARFVDPSIRARCEGQRIYRPEEVIEACEALPDPSEQAACLMRLLSAPPPPGFR